MCGSVLTVTGHGSVTAAAGSTPVSPAPMAPSAVASTWRILQAAATGPVPKLPQRGNGLAAPAASSLMTNLSTHLVGHSYGGKALGLLPDPSRLQSMHAFGTGTGWSGYMPRLEQLRVRALWDLAGPVVTRSAGYLAWSRLGLGEDLPLDVYRQWKRWCRYPHHYFEDPDISAEMVALFERVEIPIVAINSTDDCWIPPVSRDAFMSFCRNAPVTTRDIRPSDIGVTSLGHMWYFRQDATSLWDDVLADLTV